MQEKESTLDVRVIYGSITEVESDALIVNLFEGVTVPGGATGAVDRALDGAITELIASREITGKLAQMALIHTRGKISPKRVLVVGLGDSTEFDLVAVRKVAGSAVRFLRDRGVRHVTSIVHGAGIGGLDAKDATRAVVEGTILGLYRGSLYKKPEDDTNEIESFAIVERDESKLGEMEAGAKEGEILATATNEAREMGNQPSNIMTPMALAERARLLAAEYGLEFQEFDEKQMGDMGMRALLSVAQGSTQPPRMVVLKYTAGEGKPTIAFVGKGITFDSGGISIKPSENMQNMKFDMAGAAAVVQTMQAVAQLKPDVNVIAVAPATENMPSGSSYKPGDVITCMNGKTVEITTTDAEGRMILADAITYAVRQGANYIVDVATLTGGCVVALGHDITGIMGNNADFTAHLKKAAELAGERVWELPLPKDYKDMIKSNIADMTNAGPRWGSAIQGGLFLQEFVEDRPWVHMDIAGTAYTSKEEGTGSSVSYMSPGATGAAVRTLAMLAMRLGK